LQVCANVLNLIVSVEHARKLLSFAPGNHDPAVWHSRRYDPAPLVSLRRGSQKVVSGFVAGNRSLSF
jgi:hypothetical protein